MGFELSQRSLDRLVGVHPHLVAVVVRAIQLSAVDFVVTDGVRTVTRQRQLVADGKSKTMDSRHLTGHAVDVAALVAGKVSWTWSHYEQIADAFKRAAAELKTPIVWGGDWTTFRDGPHFELDRAAYPKVAP